MAKRKAINDGAYSNMVTGAGHFGMDKTIHTRAWMYTAADIPELSRMKVGDGVADRIVCSVPETALKHGVTIIGDADGQIAKTADSLGLFEALQEAGECQRLTGGAVIVTEYVNENGTNLMEAPAPGAKVAGYRVYSAYSVEFTADDFDGDLPTIYRIRRLDGATIELHPDRVTPVKGKRLPDALSGSCTRENFFGTGFLKPCEKSLKDLAGVMTSVANMAQETGVLIMGMEGLTQMLSKPDCGVKDVQNLMSTMKLSMNSMRAIYTTNKDNFNILSHSFAGLPDVIQKCQAQISADSGIPISILFGQSASGLAQTNEGDVKAYGELVESWRTRYLYRPAARLIAELAARNFGRGDISEFEWGSVNVMTTKEKVEAMAKQAQTMAQYFNIGVLTAEEIRDAVFVNGHTFDVNVQA